MKNRMKMKWLRYSLGDMIFLTFVYIFVIAAVVVCLYPLYFTVLASISDPDLVYSGKVLFLPKGLTTYAYELVMKNRDIWRGYANSIFYTVLGTIYNLVLTIPAAYALSKRRMLGRGFLMTLFIITMYFGGGMVPGYLLIKNLHLLNTRLIMIISGGISVYNVIVTRTFFQNNIPEDLYEAARIDGANEFYIFFKIVLRLSAPIIAVMTLYYGVSHWSDYFSAMLYIKDSELYPLQIVLRNILILGERAYEDAIEMDVTGGALMSAIQKTRAAVTMKYAVVFIASAPMLIIYPFVQKHFVKGIMIGALKG